MYKIGDRFIKDNEEYILCVTNNQYKTSEHRIVDMYNLINIDSGIRYTRERRLDEIKTYIERNEFKWKPKVKGDPQTTLNLKCNLEIDESRVEEIVNNVMSNIMDEIKKCIKVEIR